MHLIFGNVPKVQFVYDLASQISNCLIFTINFNFNLWRLRWPSHSATLLMIPWSVVKIRVPKSINLRLLANITVRFAHSYAIVQKNCPDCRKIELSATKRVPPLFYVCCVVLKSAWFRPCFGVSAYNSWKSASRLYFVRSISSHALLYKYMSCSPCLEIYVQKCRHRV